MAMLFVSVLSSEVATTINVSNQYTYGANMGWLDMRGDASNGFRVGQFTSSGIPNADHPWANFILSNSGAGLRYTLPLFPCVYN